MCKMVDWIQFHSISKWKLTVLFHPSLIFPMFVLDPCPEFRIVQCSSPLPKCPKKSLIPSYDLIEFVRFGIPCGLFHSSFCICLVSPPPTPWFEWERGWKLGKNETFTWKNSKIFLWVDEDIFTPNIIKKNMKWIIKFYLIMYPKIVRK